MTARSAKAPAGGTFKLYKSYSFREKDPIIYKIKTIMADEGATNADAAELSGVAASTLYNWFSGPTRMPKHACVMAVLQGLGYEFTLTKKKGAKVIDFASIHKARRKRA